MAFKGRGRNDQSDVESEREALQRQRLEAAAELEALKRSLAERVAQVQARERELADALARAEKQKDRRGSKLETVRVRLAEAKEARASLDALKVELDVRARELDARERSLDERERALAASAVQAGSTQPPPAPDTSALDARAAALDERERALDVREAELEARAAEGPTGESAASIPPADLAGVEAKLAELREAEKLFARTQHELAARSDALSERESAVDARERALDAKERTHAPLDFEELEERIRRLEQGGRSPSGSPTFSAGLRALQERGLRSGRPPDEPLH